MEHQFIQIFRLSKDVCRYLIELVRPFMTPQRRATDLSVTVRVLVALRFFAAGSYQLDVGKNLFVAVSQPSVSRCIGEVSAALNQQEIFNRWVHFPRNFQELDAVRLGFYETFNFPGVVGLIDCTHIAIFTPHINDDEYPEHIYVNRKGYHSINVQLICDHRLMIMNVIARYPGSTNDAYIWANSNIQRVFRNIHERGNTNYYLLGDSGYPLRTWLLTPLEHEPQENTPEYFYNRAHKRVRCGIERCNGLLKMRFRCLLKERVLHYAPDVACQIINACIVLHNMCIEHNIEIPEYDENANIDFGMIQGQLLGHDHQNNDKVLRRVNPELTAGRRLRNHLIQNVFRIRNQ
ncbi:hypothetical protein RI129_007256 [Pyrocoelia pectoralis]|uniref:DDE Tnp4 domain-containing protein n=1 Tax=Pyrocoelia pectoralis TaxID=417401 RepID=A0AAN7VE37_9COLE